MGAWARFYDAIMTFMTFGMESRLRRMTVELAGIREGDDVLEVGCGTGTLTLAIKERVGALGDASGIDIAPEMVAAASHKAARRHSDVSFLTASIERIPFPDASFNFVVCSFMIHHVPDDVRKRSFPEIRRVLKQGGHIFIIDTVNLQHLGREVEAAQFSEINIGRMAFGPLKGWTLRSLAG